MIIIPPASISATLPTGFDPVIRIRLAKKKKEKGIKN
jgi:hypothetical protein